MGGVQLQWIAEVVIPLEPFYDHKWKYALLEFCLKDQHQAAHS